MNASSTSQCERAKTLSLWASMLLASALVGCGGSPADRGDVSGRVLIDGQPASTGAIVFTPVDGASATAGGKIADGSFDVTAPLGLCKIAIRVPKVVGEKKLYNTPNSPVQSIMEESLPARFNDETELTYDVQPGRQEHDFELSTK
ncbi:MAG: hypothetical protein KDA44_10775 [Planctomycetales bacterium]|nr:hypothetical protein [Planctomycetales bacterium]